MYLCEGSVIVNNSQLFRREEKEKKRHTRSDQTGVGSMQIKIRERQ